MLPADTKPPSCDANRLDSVRNRLAAWTKAATIGYAIALVLWLVLVRWIGERYWLTSVALFVPPQVWLLPVAVLLPCILALRRRLLWVIAGCVLFVFFGYMRFHLPGTQKNSAGETISILSNNIGQRKTRTMWPFLKSENPDVFLLQDAWNHKRAISAENPDRYVASQGEFLIASRFEIKRSGFVPDLIYRSPAAAWFEIDFHGQPVVIYNVHMPTPRTELMRLRGRGLFSAEARNAYKTALEKRVLLAEKLLAHLEKEQRPFIVAGDFNMPETGHLRRRFTEQLTDSFAAQGSGYGLTFPGWNWNPLTLFGPWLRIDYIFASRHWEALEARREPRQPAQHLSVSARFGASDRPVNGAPTAAHAAP